MPELFHWQEKFGKTQLRCLRFQYQITGAKAINSLPAGTPVLTTFDGLASQAIIDAHLRTSGEFPAAAFDGASMAANTFGGIIDMMKQAAFVSHMEAKLFVGADGATSVLRACVEGDLTGGTPETAVAIGDSGNIAFKVDFGGSLDAATEGLITIEIYWMAK